MDDTSSSTESVNRLFKDLVDLQPLRASGRDMSKEAHAKQDESPFLTQESFEKDYTLLADSNITTPRQCRQ